MIDAEALQQLAGVPANRAVILGARRDPVAINIGSSELVTINEMVDILEEIGGVQLERSYNTSAPQGVRGRNSDNTLIQKVLGWEPSTPLRDGLSVLYPWILDRVRAQPSG